MNLGHDDVTDHVLIVGADAAGANAFRTVTGRRTLAGHPAALLPLHRRGRDFLQSRPRCQLMLAVNVRETANLETFRDLEQRPDLLLGDVDFALVHELDRGLELRPFDVLHDDYRMLAGVIEEERLKIRAAGRQDHLVGLDAMSVAGQSHVHKALAL